METLTKIYAIITPAGEILTNDLKKCEEYKQLYGWSYVKWYPAGYNCAISAE